MQGKPLKIYLQEETTELKTKIPAGHVFWSKKGGIMIMNASEGSVQAMAEILALLSYYADKPLQTLVSDFFAYNELSREICTQEELNQITLFMEKIKKIKIKR